MEHLAQRHYQSLLIVINDSIVRASIPDTAFALRRGIASLNARAGVLEMMMKRPFATTRIRHAWSRLWGHGLAMVAYLLLSARVALAQSPWERAASNLEISFTGPLARSLALVAIVIGGLMFMFGEGGAKRQISGIVFGGGLALFAVQFLTWLF